jgi:hypothetical protein
MAAAGLLIMVLISWLVATTLLDAPDQTDASVVRIPPLGAVAALRLTDGRPIFVVHHETGQITVLDGFSTHVINGEYKTLAWCPETRIFSDMAHGSWYDEWGVRQGGPAPTGMIAMRWRLGAGGLLRVEGPLGPVAGEDATPGSVDLSACTYVTHDFGADARLTPGNAARSPDGSWVVVTGAIDLQHQRMCDPYPGCTSAAPVVGLTLDLSLPPAAFEFLTTPRLWLAQVNAGGLSHLTFIPDPDAS